jgi:hypothetical protein
MLERRGGQQIFSGIPIAHTKAWCAAAMGSAAQKSGGGEIMIERFSEMWCKNVHRSAMWPIHGKYTCAKCLREHAVEWAEPAYAPPADVRSAREMSISPTAATALR